MVLCDAPNQCEPEPDAAWVDSGRSIKRLEDSLALCLHHTGSRVGYANLNAARSERRDTGFNRPGVAMSLRVFEKVSNQPAQHTGVAFDHGEIQVIRVSAGAAFQRVFGAQINIDINMTSGRRENRSEQKERTSTKQSNSDHLSCLSMHWPRLLRNFGSDPQFSSQLGVLTHSVVSHSPHHPWPAPSVRGGERAPCGSARRDDNATARPWRRMSASRGVERRFLGPRGADDRDSQRVAR